MRNTNKLRAYWSKKERDIMLQWPEGVATRSDGSWLSGVFNNTFIEELRKRGYDPSTMQFSVEPTKGNQKFTSQRPSLMDTPNNEGYS